MTQEVDVVVVGGGLGGSAIAAALADGGKSVLLLERTTEFEDRVRGEWLAPWGVAEARRLGLYETLLDAGGHVLTRNLGYDELDDPGATEALALPLDLMHPESDGPLCLEHVVMQNALLQRARDAGVDVRRGVKGVRSTAGRTPSVRFQDGSENHEYRCRIIVGADGRTSGVRRNAGIEMFEDPVDHLIAGLLIEGAHDWPEDLQATGRAGDIYYLVFPQGKGKIRLYADYSAEQRGRFGGRDGARKFLECFDIDFMPNSRSIANATPIGPCGSFPSQDAWAQSPYAEGLVLIGDAAGYNDPIVGQGQSVTLRDVRVVSELLKGSDAWRPELFVPYAEERRERMRRLRLSARFVTHLYANFGSANFGPESRERRVRARARIQENPAVAAVMMAVFAGPEVPPADQFTADYVESVFAP